MNTQPTIGSDVIDLARLTADSLRELYRKSSELGICHAIEGCNYVIPRYRDGMPRICEQEARHVFISRLPKEKFWYSVETPTKMVYRFKDEKHDASHQSARTDLTLYRPGMGTILCNIEFKASTKDYDEEDPGRHVHIQKDAIKLLCEDVPGIWFNVYDSKRKTRMQDREGGTWRVFRDSISSFINKDFMKISVKNSTKVAVERSVFLDEITEKDILFFLCDLSKRDYLETISIRRHSGKLAIIPTASRKKS